MASSLNHINAISLSVPNIIEEAYQMTIYLQEYLRLISEDVTTKDFRNHWEEINFFRKLSHTSSLNSFTTIRYSACRPLAQLTEGKCTQVIFQSNYGN